MCFAIDYRLFARMHMSPPPPLPPLADRRGLYKSAREPRLSPYVISLFLTFVLSLSLSPVRALVLHFHYTLSGDAKYVSPTPFFPEISVTRDVGINN